MQLVKIPRQVSFVCPQGKYRARVIQTIVMDDQPSDEGPVQLIKVNFEVLVPNAKNVDYRAGKKMPLSWEPGSLFRQLVTVLRGCDITPEEIENGFDVDSLLGQEADIKVVQIKNKGHLHPYSAIMGFFRPGSLVTSVREVLPEQDRPICINPFREGPSAYRPGKQEAAGEET